MNVKKVSNVHVAKIFDWGTGGKPRIARDGVIKFSKEELFVDKVIVEWKIRSHGLCLAFNQDFA